MEPIGQQNLDIVTGLDNLNSELLARDTDRRLSDLMNDQPKIDPNIKITGLDTLNPTYKAPELSEADKMMQRLMDIQKSIPHFQQGFGSKLTSENTEDKQNRFLDEDYGYRFGIDNEDFYASRKNTALNFGAKLLGRFALGTVAKLGQGIGYLGGMIDPTNWGHNYIANVSDNAFAKMFEKLDTNVKDDWMPVYQAAINRDRGFWSRMFTDSTFWTNEVSDGAAFMASAFAPGAILSKIGLGAKVAMMAGRVGEALEATEATENAVLGASKWATKAANYLQNAEKIKNGFDVGFSTLLNTASESMFEAHGVVDSVYKDAIAKGVDPQKAREIANESGTNSFLSNMVALTASNLWEQKLIHGLLSKGEAAGAEAIKTEGNALEGTLKVKEPTTRWEKFWDSPAAKIGTAALKGAAIEGFYEENIQLAIQRKDEQLGRENAQLVLDGYSDFNKARRLKGMSYGLLDFTGDVLKQYFKQTGEAIAGNDKEAADNIGLGALMGIPFGMIEAHNEHKENSAKAKLIVDAVNNAGQQLGRLNQFYRTEEVTDDKGNKTVKVMTDEKGRPQVDMVKVLSLTNEQANNAQVLRDLNEIGDPQIRSAIRKQLFANYVAANIDAGRVEQVIKDLEKVGNATPTDQMKMGIDPSGDTKAQVQEYIKLARDLQDLHESIDNDVLIKNKHVKTEEDRKLQAARRAHLFESGANMLIYRGEAEKLQGKINDLQTKLAPFSHETDGIVESLNDIDHRIASQEAVVNRTKEGTDRETAKTVLTDLQKEREDLHKDNEETIKTLKKKDGEYQYVNRDKAKAVEFAALKNMLKTKGEMDNLNRKSLEDWYKYSNMKNGFENFKARYEEENKKAQEIVDDVEKEQPEEKKKSDNPFEDYKELNDGDFNALIGTVTRELLGEQETEKDKQLRQLYQPLIDDLKPKFEAQLNNIRKLQLENKLDNLMKVNDALKVQIDNTNDTLIELQLQAEDALNKYKNNPAKPENKQGALRTLTRVTNAIQKKIFQAEKDIKEAEEKRDVNNKKMDLIIEELENNPNFRTLVALKEHVDKEKAYVEAQIADAKQQVSTLQKIIRKIIATLKSIFGSDYKERAEKGRDYAYSGDNIIGNVESQQDIQTKREKIAELQDQIKELGEDLKGIDKRHKRITADIDQMRHDFAFFSAKLAEDAVKAAKKDLKSVELSGQEKTLEDLLKGEYPELGHLIIPGDENNYDGEGYMRNLTNLFYSSSDPSEDHSPRTLQHQEFMRNLTTMSKEQIKEKIKEGEKLKVIVVTANNVGALKLNGLVDPKYFLTSKDGLATTGMYPVYVIEGKDGIHFIDKNLNKIAKLGEDVDPHQVVSTTIRAAQYRQGEEERYQKKYSKADTAKALEQALAYRRELMEASARMSVEKPITYNIALTRGIANRAKPIEEGKPVKNAVTDSLIEEKDINHNSIKVFTLPDPGKNTENVAGINGMVDAMPVGRPFLKTSNGIDLKYHYLDNNQLSKEQVDTVMHVIDLMVRDMNQKLDDIITRMNGGERLDRSSQKYQELLKKFIDDKERSKVELMNKNYVDFLQGVLHWGQLGTANNRKELSEAAESQMWIRAGRLYLGNKGANISIMGDESIKDNEFLRQFVAARYHNVNWLGDKRVGREFTEYRLEDGKLNKYTWPTYNHYLLSKYNPDGKTERKDIPLTTSIKTRAQSKQEGQPHTPYIQRGIILTDKKRDAFDKVQKKTFAPKKQEGKLTIPGEAVQTGSQTSGKLQLPGQGQVQSTSFTAEDAKKLEANEEKLRQDMQKRTAPPAGKLQLPTGTPTEAVKQEATSTPKPGKLTLPSIQATSQQEASNVNPITGKPAVTSSTPPAGSEHFDEGDIDNFLFNSGIDPTGNFRIVTSPASGVQKEVNMAKVVQDVQRMLPQFPVQVLDHVITTLSGRQAWGQFTGSAILVYQDAEHGTAYHEAFEALVNTILSDRQWKALKSEFNSREGSFTDHETGRSVKYSEATEHQAKEEMAEEFIRFKESGELPPAGKQRNFFQRLWDFIKSIFHNNDSISKVFEKLDRGDYAKSAVALTNRFSNTYRMKNIPEVYRNKFIRGATALMFQDAFYSDRSLTDFDTNQNEKELYDRLHTNLSERYTIFEKAALTNPDLKPAMREAALNAVAVWKAIDAQWEEFILDHKNFLKQYKVDFAPETDFVDDDEDTTNQNDYVQNMMTIDVKKSASASIRLLLGSLIKSKFNGTINADLLPGISDINDPTNPMFLPDLVNYDSFVQKIFNNLSGLNKEERIKEKLAEISGISQIAKSNDPKGLIKEFTDRQAKGDSQVMDMANMIRLYNRLFTPITDASGNKMSDESNWKLRVKANAYFAKQNPSSELMIVTAKGDAYFINSNAREVYEGARRQANARLRELKKVVFVKAGDKFILTSSYKMDTSPVSAEADSKDFTDKFNSWFAKKDQELISQDFWKALSQEEREKMAGELTKIRQVIARNGSAGINLISLDGLGIEGRFEKLLRVYTSRVTDEVPSQYLNVNNKPTSNFVLNNYMSRAISEMNGYETWDEFVKNNPQYNDLSVEGSQLLDLLFDENGKRNRGFSIKFGYTEGSKNSQDGEGTKNSALSLIDRNLLTFNANLDGIFYSLIPADAETEWSNRFMLNGEKFHFVQYKDDFLKEQRSQILDKLRTYLRTEMRMAKDFHNSHLLQLNKATSWKVGDQALPIGKTLRFFKDILDPKLVNDIHAALHAGDKTVDQILKENSARINKALISYIEDSAERRLNEFQNLGIIQEDNATGLFKFNMLNQNFANDQMGMPRSADGGYFLTIDKLNDLLQFHTVNYMMANQEMFKLYFGDVAQFKDATKRIKSFTSGVEWSYFSKDQGLNQFLNEHKNQAEWTNEKGEENKVDIPEDDLFHYSFSDQLNMVVGADVMVADPELYAQLQSEQFKALVGNLSKQAGVYANINEADAQSLMDIQSYREFMIKAGWRWTGAHEQQYQYEMAYARNRMAAKGEYQYSSAQLQAADQHILDSYDDHPAIASFSPLKPLYAGPEANKGFTTSLLKTSIYPVTYRMAEQFELKDMYRKLLEGIGGKRINLYAVESAHKVGLQKDKDGRITPTYDPKKIGQLSSFENTPIEQLSFEHLGIQVETQGEKTGNTLGSQLTKDIKLNLFDMGAPVDYLGNSTDAERVTKMVTFWGMTEAEKKAASPMYEKYARHEEALRNLKQVGYQQLLDRLGAKEVQQKDGSYKYEFKDLTRVRDIVLAEMQSRELDDNTLDALQLKDDLQSFARAVESMPSYDTVRNILYALVEKSILKPKVNGKPYIQVASTFFNKASRKAGYFDKEGKWNQINNASEHERAVEEKQKIIYTSSELNFYKLTKDGKEVQAMEIMLPSMFRTKINQRREALGLKKMTDEQILAYLEKEGPQLLEGIGFRIPTQATSSIEFFKVKGFLPETFGNAVVVPSAITAKAGSDFDVDKLNTYLNNWKLNSEGLPQMVRFLTDNNSKIADRHLTYVKSLVQDQLSDFQDKLDLIQARLGKKDKELTRIQHEIDMFDKLKPEKSSSGKLIAEMFNTQLRSLDDAIEAAEYASNLEVEGTTLRDEIWKIQDDMHNLIDQMKTDLSLEEFAKRPIHLQNSRAANENEYFSAIRDIIKMPEIFKYLLSPNSMENIEHNRDVVREAEGRPKESAKDVSYAQFLDFNYMNTQRHYFVRGKKDIGVFAVGMTSHANAQLNALAIAPTQNLTKYDQSIIDRNKGEFRLPFKSNTMEINGVTYTALGQIYDQDLQSIMDKISGYINGAVDVAKDPVIMDMGMLSELAGVYMVLEKAGVKGESVALFMKQPIIREFIKQEQLRKSALKYTSLFGSQKELIEYLDKVTQVPGYKYEYHILDDKMMAQMISKGTKGAWTEKLNKSELAEQQYILSNFLKARMYASHLFNNINSTNHDTSNIRSNHTVTFKDIAYENLDRKGNVIQSLSEKEHGATAIRKNTFVGNDIDILHRIQALYGDQIFALQKPNPAALLRYLGRKVYDNAFFMRAAEFEQEMKNFEVKVLDYMSNNAQILGIPGKMTVKQLTTRLFRTKLTKDGEIVENPDSLFSMWSRIKDQVANTPNHPLKSNLLLQKDGEFALQFEDDPINQITTFKLRTSPRDAYSKNRVTEALVELRQNEASSRFYQALVPGAIIQNGVRYKRDAINNLLPNEDYGAQINKGLDNIDTQDFQNFEEIIIRSSRDSELVPEGIQPSAKKKFVGFYAINKVDEKQDLRKVIRPEVTSIFQKIYFTEVPPVIFSYAGPADTEFQGASEYMYVDQIRPEFTDFGDNGKKVATKEAIEMAQKGDFSFMERIKFRRVGAAKGNVYMTEDIHMNTESTRAYETGKKVNYRYVAYKPINSWGSQNFNEIKDVSGNPGDVRGDASSLKGNRVVQEATDEQVHEALQQLNLLGAKVQIVQDPKFSTEKDVSKAFGNQRNTLSSQSNITSTDIDDILNNTTCSV